MSLGRATVCGRGRSTGRRTLFVVGACLGLLTVACSQGGGSSLPPLRPAVQQVQFSYAGLMRKYRVYAPPTPGRRPPSALVVVLHGGAATINDAVATTMFDQTAAAGNFIVAYPQGTRGEWNAGFCCGTAPGRMVDDVGFLNQVLDRVEGDYPVDRNRVYFTGVSNGAMMAYRFACENADRVTAVGSVAGSMMPDDCHPSRPVSVIELHGTADPEVPYAGGPTNTAVQGSSVLPSTPELAARWATLDGCAAPSPPSTTGPVITAAWTGCTGGTSVELVSVQGGGHVWFAPGLGAADGALDATTVIWQFFRPLPIR